MQSTEKIKDIRVHLDEDDGDTYAELEGSLTVPTEEVNGFLDELGELVRRYGVG